VGKNFFMNKTEDITDLFQNLSVNENTDTRVFGEPETVWLYSLTKEETFEIYHKYYTNIEHETDTNKARGKIRELILAQPDLGKILKRKYTETGSDLLSVCDKPSSSQIKNMNNYQGNLPSKPPKFDGRTNINKFFLQYEYSANSNGWDDQRKLLNLPTYLRDSAFEIFAGIEKTNKIESYENAKELLINRFKRALNIADLDLKDRKLKETETMTEYISSVLMLCEDVDPNMAEKMRIRHIVKGLPETLVNMVVSMKSKTIQELYENIGEAEYAVKLQEEARKNDIAKGMKELKEKLEKLEIGDKQEKEEQGLIDKIAKTVSEKLKIPIKENEEKKETVNTTTEETKQHPRGRGRMNNVRGNWKGRGYQGYYNGKSRGHPSNYRGFQRNFRGRTFRGRNFRGNFGYIPNYQNQWGQIHPQMANYGNFPIQQPYYMQPQYQGTMHPVITFPNTTNKTNVTCYNCGQQGHTKNNCPVQEKN